MKQYNKPRNHKYAWACWRRSFATFRLPQRSLSSQSLGKYWQLNQNNQKTEHTATKTNNTQNGAL